MSWIKPNFLWMMYRCGWAAKEGQERVLAIHIGKADFLTILSEAVLSTYKPETYVDEQAWKQELKTKGVRLQWDPDHDPYGRSVDRRAIQLGLKEKILGNFGRHYIRSIEDITPFVREQRQALADGGLAQLQVPVERVFTIENPTVRKTIGIEARVNNIPSA